MSLDIGNELAKAGAVYTSQHFVYASGKHGSGYINMDPLFTNVELLRKLGSELWSPFIKNGVLFETVVAPATGGIALAYATAYSLHSVVDVISGRPMASNVAWADKVGNGEFAFERAGFVDNIRNKCVLVVEDLLTTGGSVAKVCRLVEQEGGVVVGVSSVCNRGGVTAEDLGVNQLESIMNVSFKAVEPDNCQLCKQKMPIVADIGHGSDYKADNPNYQGGYVTLMK